MMVIEFSRKLDPRLGDIQISQQTVHSLKGAFANMWIGIHL